MEIERKFLVKKLPANLHEHDNFNINQCYLSYSPEIRIRAKDDKRYLTIKSNGDLVRKEVELRITKEEYEDLKEMTVSKPICKTRFEIKESEHAYELDIFHSIPDLIIVEVEFKDVFESKRFIKPSWFGKEITYDGRYKNKNLAKNGI